MSMLGQNHNYLNDLWIYFEVSLFIFHQFLHFSLNTFVVRFSSWYRFVYAYAKLNNVRKSRVGLIGSVFRVMLHLAVFAMVI